MSEESQKQRQAAIVSVDVFGFARDTEEARTALARAIDLVTLRLETAADRHGGRLFRRGEDGFFLTFDAPEAAVVAGDEIALGPRPPVGVGVHMGPVAFTATGELVGGPTVDEAEAIQKAAPRSVVLVSDAARRALKDPELTKRLTKDGAPIRVKGGGAIQARELGEPVDEEVVKQKTRRNLLVGAASTVVVAGLVAVIFGHDIMTTLYPKHDHVAVQRFRAGGEGGAAADFSDGLTDEIDYVLGQGQIPTVSRADAESLRAANADPKVKSLEVGAVLDGSVEGDANALDVKLNITDPVHHRLVWSHEFTGAGDDLKTQTSSRVIQVLTCSAKALKPGSTVTDPDILTLYVKFCDLDAEAAGSATALADEERILRELTNKAPNFSYGHSQLALFLFSKSQVDQANAKALIAEAGAEADRAIALDPKNGDGYVARTRLLAPPNWANREHNLLTALSLPAPGFAPQVVYAMMLLEVGRLKDSTDWAKKAATLSPWDADIVGLWALTLAETNKADEADLQLTRSIQIAANDPNVQFWRFHMYQWFGRWDDSLKILGDDANRPAQLTQEEDLAAAKAFNIAILKGDAASKTAARDAEIASVKHDRSHLMVALSHLSALGFVDDAYQLADEFPPAADADQVSVLFEPLTDGMRRDPRFITLAGKLGLISYWSAAGKWPDFCSAPDLPYRCAVEAQKVAAK